MDTNTTQYIKPHPLPNDPHNADHRRQVATTVHRTHGSAHAISESADHLPEIVLPTRTDFLLASSGQRKLLVLLRSAGVSSLEHPLQTQLGPSDTTHNPSVAQSDSCWMWRSIWIQQNLQQNLLQALALPWRTGSSVRSCVFVCGYILRFFSSGDAGGLVKPN